LINKNFEVNINETEELIRITSMLLSSITHQLACVSYPKLETGILEKLQIVNLTSSRILVIITIKSGLVKTITLELTSNIKSSQIDSVQSLLNEKLAGLTFNEIRKTFKERFKDVEEEQKPIIRVFVDSIDKIFTNIKRNESLVITGAKNVIRQPEFEDPHRFQGIIELIEDKDVIIHIMEKSNDNSTGEVYISIGSENEMEMLHEYSLVSKEYKLGDISGTLGIIGPKRMEYSRIVAIVDYMANVLTDFMKNTNT